MLTKFKINLDIFNKTMFYVVFVIMIIFTQNGLNSKDWYKLSFGPMIISIVLVYFPLLIQEKLAPKFKWIVPLQILLAAAMGALSIFLIQCF